MMCVAEAAEPVRAGNRLNALSPVAVTRIAEREQYDCKIGLGEKVEDQDRDGKQRYSGECDRLLAIVARRA